MSGGELGEQRNIIFLFDGTGNEPADAQDAPGGESISNIFKLHLLFGGGVLPAADIAARLREKLPGALADNKQENAPPQNLPFYFRGIGTRGNWLRRACNAAFAPGAWDAKAILDDADILFKNYHRGAGDKVFIFGFSRGAALARMFARQMRGRASVCFLGCFDTVAALNGSADLRRETTPGAGELDGPELCGVIRRAAHAVALDENRKLFAPTLFARDPRVDEIWFAGVHSDIGGGYWRDGLSDIALAWMLERAQTAATNGGGDLPAMTLEKMCFSKTPLLASGVCADDVALNPQARGKLHEHSGPGLALAPRNITNLTGYAGRQLLPRVHKSVAERFAAVADYRPIALRGQNFVIDAGRGGDELGLPVCGVAGLREERRA